MCINRMNLTPLTAGLLFVDAISGTHVSRPVHRFTVKTVQVAGTLQP